MSDGWQPPSTPDLVEELPVFPLTGVLLLPGAQLPLQIFEPRYCNLLEDVMAGEQCFGIVQPWQPTPEDLLGAVGPPDGGSGPPLYDVGCVGRVEHLEALPGSRFFVLLRGLRRYRSAGELGLHRDYRRVRAETTEFATDDLVVESAIRREAETAAVAERPEPIDAGPVLTALERFGERHPIEIDLEALREVDGGSLVDGVSMALPFAPAEKQALLEAATRTDRRDLLATLLAMGLELGADAPRPN